MDKKIKLSTQEKNWALYDIGNSAFILIIVTTIMPIFFKDVASKGINNTISTSNWAFGISLSSLILAFLAPILGTLADYRNFKKRFLAFFLILGIFFTLLLSTVGEGDWLLCLVIFIFANIGFKGANIFYDSFLIDITTNERMDWVSSSGYGWGYIGSTIPFIISIMIIFFGQHGEGNGLIPIVPVKIVFFITAIWWFFFSIPLLKRIKQKYYIEPESSPIKKSFSRMLKTFKEIRKYKNVFLFLTAYFFYIDGVDTVIVMATAYGRDVGLSVSMLIFAILIIQVVAFPFVLIYGKLAQKYTTKTMLFVGIIIFAFITILGFILPILPSQQLKTYLFWVLSFLIATSLGGIQALSRSFFGKLIPKNRSAEFFGFYNIFGKFAAIFGPLMIGIIGRVTGYSRYGVLSLFILFFIGGFLLSRVKNNMKVEP